MIETHALRWSPFSVLTAAGVSVVSFAGFLFFEYLGYASDIPALGTVTSSLAGAVVLWRRHPKTWWVVLLFYVPVMSVLLVVGTVLIAAQFGYPFET